jgi:hypothetical protein
LKANVIDSDGGEISFTTIGIKNSFRGVIADEHGHFEIYVEETDVLLISAMGYNAIYLPVKEIKEKVILKQKIENLDEVIIKRLNLEDYKKNTHLGIYGYRANGIIKTTSGYSLATKIVGSENKTEGVLRKIYAQFDKKNLKQARLRLRVYKINMQNGKPGENLLQDNIIIDVSKKNATYDVSKYQIIIPPEGCFVGFDWLTESKNLGKPQNKNGIVYQLDFYEPFIRTTDKVCQLVTYSKIFNHDWNVYKPVFSKCPNNAIISALIQYKADE